MDKLFDFAVKSSLPIKNYREQWQQQRYLLQYCKSVLPESLQHAVAFVTIQDDNLIVLTSTAALASRLRLSQRELLKAAQQQDIKILHVIVRIKPPITDEEAPLMLLREAPSSQTQHDLATLASNMADKELKESLENLLRVFNSRSPSN